MVIYTDGSTRGNGKKNATGGFGVAVFDGEDLVNAYSEHHIGTTNNRMEMSAIIWALRHYGARPSEFFTPVVYSDSMYCVNSFNTWIKGWKANGWTKAQGKTLENKDLIMEYDRLTCEEGLRIDLRYIKGHAGEVGNEIADSLATGALTPEQAMQTKWN